MVINSLCKELASPDQIRVYAERYIKARIVQGAHENHRRAEIEARIAAIIEDNDRLLDLLKAGKGDQDAADARMKAQGKERDELKQELARREATSSCTRQPSRHLPTS
ncbi:hypothetical protein [Mesorhizobium sp. B2-4-6]|uniref:hypothetical protein n=1 Tax=Mesorhizobium sp. B2-4-6 TaxID=2589943 RepID=UPI0011280FEB|nr:hypothetical protein [Mesorhizobium sp. B2-4-6]TPL54059.1 hypothetical protein FJ957_01415 [Mesorhizobium sp. B2-4-6]